MLLACALRLYLIDKIWLEERWLLIFDDVQDPDGLDLYWPKTAQRQSSIILTAQHNLRSFTSYALLLQSLEPHDGARILTMARYPDDETLDEERHAAEQLSVKIGSHPLALAQIAAYIAQTSLSIAEAYQHFQQSSHSFWLTDSLSRIRDYESCLIGAWDSALGQLEHQDMLLLQLMSLLAAEIPEAFIRTEVIKGEIWGLTAGNSEALYALPLKLPPNEGELT